MDIYSRALRPNSRDTRVDDVGPQTIQTLRLAKRARRGAKEKDLMMYSGIADRPARQQISIHGVPDAAKGRGLARKNTRHPEDP